MRVVQLELRRPAGNQATGCRSCSRATQLAGEAVSGSRADHAPAAGQADRGDPGHVTPARGTSGAGVRPIPAAGRCNASSETRETGSGGGARTRDRIPRSARGAQPAHAPEPVTTHDVVESVAARAPGLPEGEGTVGRVGRRAGSSTVGRQGGGHRAASTARSRPRQSR